MSGASGPQEDNSERADKVSSGQADKRRQNVRLAGRDARALAALGVETVDLPDTGALTARQRAFAENVVANGGNEKLAALAAGYPAESLRDALTDLRRHAGVQAAIRLEQAASVARLVRLSDKVVGDILADGAQHPKVRLTAARLAYERSGSIKRAQLDAARGDDGRDLSAMSVGDLERLVRELGARVQAAGLGPMIDVTPGGDASGMPSGSDQAQDAPQDAQDSGPDADPAA